MCTGGFDGTAEELHKYGLRIALELGWNAFAFDGPGQGGMLVEHGVTMRPDFENVLTPVLDWLLAQPDTDPDRVLLVGRSLGGYLAPRAASADHRIAALVCDPGQYDFTSRFRSSFSDEDWQRVVDADAKLDADLEGFLAKPRDREFYGARMAAMGAGTFGAWLRTLTGYTLAGRAAEISCPTLVTDGEGDFASQSQVLFDALTCAKQYRPFTAAQGAGGHLEGMGQRLWQQVVYPWLSEIAGSLARRPGAACGFRSGEAAGQDAELVAFRVGERDPALGAGLADVGGPGTQAEQPADLLVLLPVGRVDVEVDPVLDDLALGHEREGQRRWHRAAAVLAIRHLRRADCDQPVLFVLHHVAKDRAPEPGQTAGVGAVDRKLGELTGHVRTSRSGSGSANGTR